MTKFIVICDGRALQSAKAYMGLQTIQCGKCGADAAAQDSAAEACTGKGALSTDEAWLKLPSRDLDLPLGKQKVQIVCLKSTSSKGVQRIFQLL